VICTAFAKGKIHDYTILLQSGVLDFLGTQKVLVDSGYQGLQHLHSNTAIPFKRSKNNPLTKGQKMFNRAVSSFRILVENVIGSIKRFRILSDVYRHRRKRFSLRFNLISAIHNLELI